MKETVPVDGVAVTFQFDNGFDDNGFDDNGPSVDLEPKMVHDNGLLPVDVRILNNNSGVLTL